MTQFALCWKGLYPANVVFFRDGVSEGEYEQVSEGEIDKIKSKTRDTHDSQCIAAP